jgi:hypothetical protein
MEIIERASMVDCKPCTTPVDTSSKFSHDMGDPVSDPTHYHSLADTLQYLTFTCPREPHMTALKRILHYLQGTLNFGLLLCRSSTFEFVVYSDAD